MAIYKEVISVKDGYRLLPQISKTSVRLLWHSDWWDGPIEGMLEYEGEQYWYVKCDENDADEGWFRRFLIVELYPQQIAEEEHWHKLFQQHVRPGPHQLQSEEEWKLFYDPYKARKPRNLEDNEVIGWFET